MKSAKAAPKNNAARAKNTRGKKSGFINKKEESENSTLPVSKKEDDSLQAMHSKIQAQLDDESAPAMQAQAEEQAGDVQAQVPDENIQKSGEEKMEK